MYDLLTRRRLSDIFDPSPKLRAYSPEADIELPSEFCHVTVILRNTTNFFLAIPNLGRVSIHSQGAEEHKLPGLLLFSKGVYLQVMSQHSLTKAIPSAVQCI